MAQQDEDALLERLRLIHQRYETQFAGQPRITRDAGVLDNLVAEVQAVDREAGGLGSEAVRTLAAARVTLYTDEAAAVREAQAGGPDALQAHLLTTWARFALRRYRRHFAGRSRATRDVGLLGELIADLERIDVEMTELARRHESDSLLSERDQVRDSLGLYRGERGAIAGARGAGTLGEQASILASIANDQFALYRAHFAGKSRLSRRPARLERMVSTLEQVADRMNALQIQGLHDESNERNIQVVAERLGMYRKELEAVRGARQGTTMERLVHALGEEANALFEEYRGHFAGQDRATRDLDLLDRLFEALHDVGRQMEDLDQVRPDENNQRNLAIVLDHLRLYGREDDLIRQARQPDES